MSVEPPSSPSDPIWTRLPLLLVVAAVVRAVAFARWAAWPGSSVWIVDTAWHARLAMAIRGGDLAAGTETWVVTPGPAWLYAVSGWLGAEGPLAQAGVQLLIGVVSVAPVWFLARDLGGARAAGAAGWLAALSGPLIFQDLSLLSVSPSVIGLALAGRAAVTGKHPVAGGFGLGAAAWMRPNLLLVLPMVLAVAAGRGRRTLGWMALGAGLALAPGLVRNLVVGGEAVPLAANGGYNLALSHAPGLRQNLIAAVDAPTNLDGILAAARAEPERALGHPVKPGEADRWWQREAFHGIAADPEGFVLRTLGRAWLVVGALDTQDHRAWHAHRRDRFGWLPDPAVLLPGLALLGLFSLPRRRALEMAALLGACVGSVALFVLFERYRLPFLALVLPLAGVGLVRLVERPRLAAVVLVVGFAASFDPFRGRLVLPWSVGPVPSTLEVEGVRREAGELAAVGGALVEEGRLAEAIPMYERALQIVPERPDLAQSLAALLLRADRADEAVRVAQALAERFPTDPRRALLSCSVQLQAERLGAREACERARLLDPRSAAAWYQAGMARWAAGDADGATEAVVRALRLDPDLPGARAALAELTGR